MSESLPLLHVHEAVEAAEALRRRVDTALDARRAITGLSTSAIVSIAILAGQLDRIARAAAFYSCRATDHASWVDLQEQLIAAGYLPLSSDQEPSHGQG